MNQKEREKQEQYLEIYYQSLHITVIYENDFLSKLHGSQIELWAYRDEILDKINVQRRLLGRLI